METFMNGAVLIEGALLSFLVALWMTWLGLRGLFRLMPAASSPVAGRSLANSNIQSIRFIANRQEPDRRRDVA
jgi:hypothetical protein